MSNRFISLMVLVAFLTFLLPVGAFAELNATNGFYSLFVENTNTTDGIGTFTVATGASHPFPNENVLFGGASGDAWSTYLTIRSYTSSTDYVSTGSAAASAFAVAHLNSFSPVLSAIGTTGYTTSWSITGSDTLGVQQVTNIEGTTLADSRVRVTTTVTNHAETPVQIGIRYMWDWMINGSDASTIKRHNPTDAAFSTTFFEQTPPGFEYYEETNSGATFSIFGTANGPAVLSPAPTPPQRFNYSSWGDAYDNAWTFAVTGSNLDSAVCYFWGDTPANAITLNPGQSYSVTQYLTTAEQSIGGTTSQPPQNVPTMTEWGMIAFMLLAGLGSVLFLRKQRRA